MATGKKHKNKMATFARLMEGRREVIDQIFQRQSDAENRRILEYDSAVKIQSWFRATRVRSYIRFLNYCARTIQRHFRGFKGREIYRHIVKEHVKQMRINFYNAQATKIQKVWRGYYTRKYIHNYYSRKAFLTGLVVKNEIVRQQLHELSVAASQERARKAKEEQKAAQEIEARKTHYLISTHQIPGVYNSPYDKKHFSKEHALLAVRAPSPKTRAAISARLRTGRTGTLDVRGSVKAAEKDMKYEVLPPITTKMQGPFREPQEVWKQRHKKLNPTLRVDTSYTSAEQARAEMKAEEWVTRVIDDKFVPFTHRTREYEPLLHSTSAFGSLPYGTKYFRESDPGRHITSKRFETVTSPIPIFEQYGKTY